MPLAIIYDNAKESILGNLNRKHEEALCHLKETAAKREIMELKKHAGRKVIKSDALKRLWGDCLNLSLSFGLTLHMAVTNWTVKSL